jgi:micrococcal nuclease
MIRTLFLLLVLTGCSTPTPIAETVAPGVSAGWRAIDGDTIIDAAGRSIRVIGVDTPEMPGHAQCAAEAMAAVAARAFTASALAGAQRIELQEKGTDRYRRTLAIVLIDGRDLAEMLIAAGHGRLYRGEKRRSWC